MLMIFLSSVIHKTKKLKAYLAPHGAVEVDSNKWLGRTINHDFIEFTSTTLSQAAPVPWLLASNLPYLSSQLTNTALVS